MDVREFIYFFDLSYVWSVEGPVSSLLVAPLLRLQLNAAVVSFFQLQKPTSNVQSYTEGVGVDVGLLVVVVNTGNGRTPTPAEAGDALQY